MWYLSAYQYERAIGEIVPEMDIKYPFVPAIDYFVSLVRGSDLLLYFGAGSSQAYSHFRQTQAGGSQLRAFTMAVVVEPQRGHGGFLSVAGLRPTAAQIITNLC